MKTSTVLMPLLYLILAAATYAAINTWTFWPTPYKYVLPAALAIVAVIDFFVRLDDCFKAQKTNATPPTARTVRVVSAQAVVKPTPVPAKKPEKKTIKESNGWIDVLQGVAVSALLITLLFLGLAKLAEFFANNTQQAIAANRSTIVVHAFPIDHTYNQKKELLRHLWIDPGKTYDVFEMKNGQHWEWYIQRDIEYRINATGQEPFIPLPRRPDYSQELLADRPGMLQVRTKHANNHVEAYRLREYVVH